MEKTLRTTITTNPKTAAKLSPLAIFSVLSRAGRDELDRAKLIFARAKTSPNCSYSQLELTASDVPILQKLVDIGALESETVACTQSDGYSVLYAPIIPEWRKIDSMRFLSAMTPA